jgi:hypothetical protein
LIEESTAKIHIRWMNSCAVRILSNLVLIGGKFDHKLVIKIVDIVFMFLQDLVSLNSDKRFVSSRQNHVAAPENL